MARFGQGSTGSSDSLHVPVNPELFTDTAELPLLGWQEKADTLVACIYCLLLAVYGMLLVSSWLPLPLLLSQVALFSVCNLLLLVVTGFLQRHLSAQLKRMQQQGFLKFSVFLMWIVSQPFKIVAYGTGTVLMVVTWGTFLQQWGIPPLLFLRVILLVQIIWMGVLVSVFIYKVHIHNTSHCQPDVVCTLSAVLQGPPTLDDIRYVDSGGLAEQQAALLHYQQDNLQHLSKEILRLQESLSKYEHTQDGNTPQVDLVHLLAAREQELRAIAAERDQLQAEVRLARGFISERDADILRVRAINDQYVEENERLRAMLDEWSSHTAKLELALQTERVLTMESRRNHNHLSVSPT